MAARAHAYTQANIGWYTLYLAVAGCRVISVEPVPYNHNIIELASWINGAAICERIHLIRAAAADADGEAIIHWTQGETGMSYIVNANLERSNSASTHACVANVIPVRTQTRTLDSILANMSMANMSMQPGADVALLKIDVEGFEVLANPPLLLSPALPLPCSLHKRSRARALSHIHTLTHAHTGKGAGGGGGVAVTRPHTVHRP